ncbi:MAG: hypothetical protein IJT85_02320 [Ruminococcus sp.]|jgi:DNA repair protein RadC|nr:hypothetical protein [Ruminococcus sp.]MBQ7744393.1 hypothetical protein [Ruminococcus sp.]
MSSDSSVHKGHRKTLKKKFIENGLDVFEPHEALELYLYYAIPRKDTNPLAHRLLDRFVTLAGVCDAPIDELIEEFGLTENTAVLLKLLPEMARLYNESKLSNDNVIDLDTIGDLIKSKFIGRTEEVVVLLLGDAKGKIIFFDVVAKGSVNSSDMPIRKIVDLSIRHNARLAFIAHNHPSGNALPSKNDLATTDALKATLNTVGVRLFDHFIVTDDDYVSLRESELI